MSPTERRQQMRQQDWKGWDVLFKVGIAAIPFLVPFMAWLGTETLINREFRNRGARYTKEDHIEYKAEVDLRLEKMEDKQDAIYDTVSRIDERVLSIQKNIGNQ